MIDEARKFGLTTPIPAYPSIFIGAADVYPIEMVAAYTAFATLGTRATPKAIMRVEDQKGNVLWEPEPTTVPVMSPEEAWLMVSMMKDVVRRGTAAGSVGSQFHYPAGGKTGTTNDGTDVWFIGYTSDLVAGVWMGFDRPQKIKANAQGGVLAAPAWTAFMNEVYRRKPAPRDWPMPADIVTRADRRHRRTCSRRRTVRATSSAPSSSFRGTDPILRVRRRTRRSTLYPDTSGIGGVSAVPAARTVVHAPDTAGTRTSCRRPDTRAAAIDPRDRSRHVDLRFRRDTTTFAVDALDATARFAAGLVAHSPAAFVDSTRAFHPIPVGVRPNDTRRIRTPRLHDLAAGRLPRALHLLRRRALASPRSSSAPARWASVRRIADHISRDVAQEHQDVDGVRALPRRPRAARRAPRRRVLLARSPLARAARRRRRAASRIASDRCTPFACRTARSSTRSRASCPPGLTVRALHGRARRVVEQLAREMPVDIFAHPTLVTLPFRDARRRRAVDRGARDAHGRRAVHTPASRSRSRRAIGRTNASCGAPIDRGVRISLGSDGHTLDAGRRHQRARSRWRARSASRDDDLYDPTRHGSKTGDGTARAPDDSVSRALGRSDLVAADRATASSRSTAIASRTSAPPTARPPGDDVDLGDVVLMPGLVNAHCHLELTAMRGFLEDLDFRRWILRLTGARRAVLDRDALLDSARYGLEEGVRAGITTYADTCDSGVVMQAMREAGVRGVMYQEVFGPDPAQCDDVDAPDFARRSPGLRYLETPLVRVGDLAARAVHGVRRALSRDDRARARAAACRWRFTSPRASSSSALVVDGRRRVRRRTAPARHRRRAARASRRSRCSTTLGVLDVRAAAHSLRARRRARHSHASPRRAARVAHCPASNAKLGHGIAPLDEMLAAGIVVGLGSDSMASNNRMDLLEEARLALLAQRARIGSCETPEAVDVLEMATIGGARRARAR